MPNQRDVQQLIQSLTPSAVNNGNPNTVYNQPMPQGGYIPPTFDPGTNTWRINPAPAPSTVNWQQMSASQPQSWGWQGPAQPTPPTVPTTPLPTTPTNPVPPTSVTPTTTAPVRTGNSNPGPGGDIGCVVIDSFLSDYDRADQVEVDDEMFVIDPISYRKSVGKVSYSETKLMPCVRIMTESGIILDCSTTAPIADQFGEQILAPNLLNKLIPVCDDGVFYLDRVASIEDLGELEVRHITVEDNFFLAGKEKGKYLFHHNMKRIADQDNPQALRQAMDDYLGLASQGAVYGGGVGGSSNTRGAMQQNGTWDSAHGGTMSNPATSWGQGQMDSQQGAWAPPAGELGQGLLDVYGNPASGATNESGYMTDAWKGLGNSNIDSWDTSWMQAIGNDNIPTMPAVQTSPEQQGFWGNLWDKVKAPILTVADWALKGNLYHSDTGEVAPWESWVTSAADSLLGTGGLAQQGLESYGKNGLKDGYDSTASSERAAIGGMQYQYQQSSPQKQAAMVQSMIEQKYPQAVIDAVTGSESYWQGTR